MDEVDNCPVCNTTVVLQHGFEKGAFELDFGEDKEVCYAICKICGTKFRRREEHFPNHTSKAIYEKWTCLLPEINLKFFKLGPALCRWIKVKEKKIPVETLGDVISPL